MTPWDISRPSTENVGEGGQAIPSDDLKRTEGKELTRGRGDEAAPLEVGKKLEKGVVIKGSTKISSVRNFLRKSLTSEGNLT